MTKTKLLLTAIACFIISNSYSQNYQDVLRYSQKFYQSSARSAGSGSAFGAIGADPVSFSINPAGLGLYRRNEFTMGVGYEHPTTTSTYFGNDSFEVSDNLNVSNMNLVIANLKYDDDKPKTEGWVAFNFAIGFNRTNSFNKKIYVKGVNDANSFTQSFLGDAEGRSDTSIQADDKFSLTRLAYEAYLIDNNDKSKPRHYTSASQTENPTNFKSLQTDEISYRGSMNDINLSIGGNYSNNFFIGASVLIPTINYHYQRTFTETNQNPNFNYYKSSQYTEYVNTTGVGISANAGIIYKPNDNFRFGVSGQLPTFYSMSDDYKYSITGNFINNASQTSNSPTGEFPYSIVTPSRVTISAAAINNKYGFLSLDYEFIGYNTGRIATNYEGARQQNENVRYYYRGIGNLRIGGELRYDLFSFRAGYGLYGSPYNSSIGAVPTNAKAAANAFTFGAGYREKTFFIDAAYQIIQSNSFYLPYSISSGTVNPGATINSSANNIIITFGTRF
ncbi:MAG: hypothetical protein NTX03_00300 [Bacteroidetes bacterium]|nr:hypothetical protein [Bacteroidota bacterium]